MLLVLFGTPGVGKSFVGSHLSKKYDFHFYDADVDLTPDMIQTIREEKIYTPEMRKNFFNIVIENVKHLHQQHRNIVVAQAWAKEINRQQFLNAFPDARFFHIHANEQNINARLNMRDGWVSVEYADKIRKVFQPALIPHNIIDNNRDEIHLNYQFDQLFHLENDESHRISDEKKELM